MGSATLIDLFRGAMVCAVEVGAPFILAALVVGLLSSVLQAATQLSEGALSFIPKVVAVGLVVVLMGPWLLNRLVHFTELTHERVVEVAKGQMR
jgi:flagellar biosynthetic protein FliQ